MAPTLDGPRPSSDPDKLCGPRPGICSLYISASFPAKQEVPRFPRSGISAREPQGGTRVRSLEAWGCGALEVEEPQCSSCQMQGGAQALGGQEGLHPLSSHPIPGFSDVLSHQQIGRCWSDVTGQQPGCTAPRELPLMLLLLWKQRGLGGRQEAGAAD